MLVHVCKQYVFTQELFLVNGLEVSIGNDDSAKVTEGAVFNYNLVLEKTYAG